MRDRLWAVANYCKLYCTIQCGICEACDGPNCNFVFRSKVGKFYVDLLMTIHQLAELQNKAT